MENQIYKLGMSDNYTLELYVCNTNEVTPYKPIKEIGIIAFKNEWKIDASLSIAEIDSLIKYLSECREYINEYNTKSTP